MMLGHMDLVSVSNDPKSGPQYMLAQELMDALPVHSFQKTKDGWRERLVDLASTDEGLVDEENSDVSPAKVDNADFEYDENGNPLKKPRFRFVLSRGPTHAVRTLLKTDKRGNIEGERSEHDDAEPGDILEVCPEAMSLAQDMTKRVNKVSVNACICVGNQF